MKIECIQHLPDDILTHIFYYLKSSINPKKDIHFLMPNPYNGLEYILSKKNNMNPTHEIIMMGKFSDLWNNDMRQRRFFFKKYNPYYLTQSGDASHIIETNSFLKSIKSLKYLSSKELKEVLRINGIKQQKRTKKDMIQLILKV